MHVQLGEGNRDACPVQMLFNLHDQPVTHLWDMTGFRPNSNLPVDTAGPQAHQENLTWLIAGRTP
jgi:hypothetical protein